MIERASFTNFKSLRHVSVSLGRFMVIVGPNGSGKTSILDGLLYLSRAAGEPLFSLMSGVYEPENLRSKGATSPMVLVLTEHLHGTEGTVRIEFPAGEQALKKGESGAVVFRRWGKDELRTDGDGNVIREPLNHEIPKNEAERIWSEDFVMNSFAARFASTRKFRLEAEQIAAPSYSDEETPSMRINGEGLASVLTDLAARSPETFQSIQDAARAVVPTLERIRTQRAKVTKRETHEIRIDDKPIVHEIERPVWGQQIVLDFKGAPNTPAPLSSEGTLLAIGLLTALWTSPRPRLLLLDDIDKALHPRAQGELVAQLRKVLAMDPDLQIIATSHSPYLLDHFEPREVLVTALGPDGSTACAALPEHPDFGRWNETMRTGELWTFAGEDWVIARADAQQSS